MKAEKRKALENAGWKITEDTDDFFVEDVLTNLTKKRKKSLNSKDKGRRGESDLCKVFAKRFPDLKGFFRVVGSGNSWSHHDLTEQAKEVMTGDVVCPEGFKFTIECKYGYADIDLCAAFDNGHKELDKFLEQAEKDAGRFEKNPKKPMLCWKKPRQGWIAFIKGDTPVSSHCHLPPVVLQYKGWIALSLDALLKYPDHFFI